MKLSEIRSSLDILPDLLRNIFYNSIELKIYEAGLWRKLINLHHNNIRIEYNVRSMVIDLIYPILIRGLNETKRD